MHILITRPQPDADDLARTLEAMGHQCTISPLLKLEYFTPPAFDLTDVQAVIITSRNAVRALENRSGTTALLKRPLYVVGRNTASFARDLGFTDIHAVAENARHLASHIRDNSDPAAGRFLYLTGKKLAFDMEAYLTKHNIHLNRTILYRATSADDLSLHALENIRNNLINGTILLSPQTAKTYANLIQKHHLTEHVRNFTHFCLSQNVANELLHLIPGTSKIPEQSNIMALLSLIKNNT